MKRFVGAYLLLLVVCSCNNNSKLEKRDYSLLLQNDIYCRSSPAILASWGNPFINKLTKIDHPRMVYADEVSESSHIYANDNRVPAGRLENDVLKLDLEVSWGNFFMETDDRPGLSMAAIGEKGKNATIPAPLIRIEEGVTLEVTITNTLADSTITVFGLQERPSLKADSIFILPGKSKTVSFLAGKPGTYLYWVKLGKGIGKFFSKSNFYGEEEQLSGAFIIDPKNSKVNDRIIVMNIFSTMEEPGNREKGSFESLTMNGKTWPFTELLKFDVGDSVQWRIINSSNRGHPMHLHGFYFKVNSIGSMLEDSYYEPKDVRTVVTESMAGKSTMVMSWVPSRPGRWIFHCHLSFHVSPLLRLPGATDMDPEGSHVHMSGLASGIEVNDGPTDLIEKGESRQVTIFANEYKNSRHHKGFSFQDIASDNADLTSAPGPLLILKRFQSTYVKVVNHLSDPTSVHWHGLELDAWADGVPQWSSSEGKQSPIIEPGEEFTYKLSAMRAGTFIYHSHLDDIHQITQGLYGPIIVLDENETFNAKLDHPYIVSWNASDDSGETFSFKNLELNGQVVQPEMKIKVGERHRLRLINISPAGKVNIQMTKNNEIIELLYLAKDGADLPQAQQIQLEKSPNYGPGETADFEFEPTEAGVYTLKIESKIFKQSWNQKWIVSN